MHLAKIFLQNNWVLCLLLILSVGCRSLKNLAPSEYAVEQLIKEDFHKLSGTYHNHTDTVFGKIDGTPYDGRDKRKARLLQRLITNLPNQAYEEDVSVKIEFISAKRAIVNAYQHDQLFFTRKIRGKFKGQYFHVRPKVIFAPLIPILYVHHFQRVRIGKLSDGIIVDYSIRMWGFALLAGGDENGRSTAIYKTAEQNTGSY